MPIGPLIRCLLGPRGEMHMVFWSKNKSMNNLCLYEKNNSLCLEY